MGSPAPGVQLDFNVHWCARHLQPFASNWPSGSAVMVELFNEAVQMPAVIDAAKSDTANLNAALGRFSPLCCFIGADGLARVYAKAGVAA